MCIIANYLNVPLLLNGAAVVKVDKPLALCPGVQSSIFGSSSLSDDTQSLSRFHMNLAVGGMFNININKQ